MMACQEAISLQSLSNWKRRSISKVHTGQNQIAAFWYSCLPFFSYFIFAVEDDVKQEWRS